MFQRLCRRFFNTKPAKRSAPKLHNHSPNGAGQAVVLDNGCTFTDLTAAKTTTPLASSSIPPLLRNFGGQFLDGQKVDEMKTLRREKLEAWTITQLAKKFEVSRSFVIANVLEDAERDACKQEIDDALAKKSIKQQKGWILRHKIRRDRLESW